jgi:hypothetical protein
VLSKNGAARVHMRGGVNGSAAYSILSGPLSGVLTLLDASAGMVTYTPNVNFTGSDSFVFQVTDGACSTNATVYLDIADTSSSDPTCIDVAGIQFVDSQQSAVICWTNTLDGVVVSSGCVTNDETSLGGVLTGSFCSGNTCSGVNFNTNAIVYSTNHTDACGSTTYGATWTHTGNAWTFSLPTGVSSKRWAINNDFCNALGYTNIHVQGTITFSIPSGGSGNARIEPYLNGCNFVTGSGFNINNGAGAFATNGTGVLISFDIPLTPGAVYTPIELEAGTGTANCSFSGSFTNIYQK